jgi:hypothetical protein
MAMLGALTQIFMPALGGFIVQFFLLFLLGALLSGFGASSNPRPVRFGLAGHGVHLPERRHALFRAMPLLPGHDLFLPSSFALDRFNGVGSRNRTRL